MSLKFKKQKYLKEFYYSFHKPRPVCRKLLHARLTDRPAGDGAVASERPSLKVQAEDTSPTHTHASAHPDTHTRRTPHSRICTLTLIHTHAHSHSTHIRTHIHTLTPAHSHTSVHTHGPHARTHSPTHRWRWAEACTLLILHWWDPHVCSCPN